MRGDGGRAAGCGGARGLVQLLQKACLFELKSHLDLAEGLHGRELDGLLELDALLLLLDLAGAQLTGEEGYASRSSDRRLPV